MVLFPSVFGNTGRESSLKTLHKLCPKSNITDADKRLQTVNGTAVENSERKHDYIKKILPYGSAYPRTVWQGFYVFYEFDSTYALGSSERTIFYIM